MLRIWLLIFMLSIVGCSPASFNRDLASSVQTITQADSQNETGLVDPVLNNPDSKEPILEIKKYGVKVGFPFHANFIDVIVGTTSNLKVVIQAGICKVSNETSITNEAYLCNDDSGLFKDFCSTTEKIITDKNDYTCQQIVKSQRIVAAQGVCSAHQITLLAADLRDLQDPAQYQVINLDTQNSLTTNDLFSAATKIGLTADCQCYYQTMNPDFNLYTAQWPALNAHCHKYFPIQY